MPAGVSGSFRSITAVRAGAADVLLAAVVQGRMQFAERMPVASRRYTKKPADARFTSAGAKMCSAVRCETARAAEQG